MMSEKLPQHLQQIMDNLCGDGCSAVRKYIEQIESGESLPVLENLSATEKTKILHELKQVMAVYDRC